MNALDREIMIEDTPVILERGILRHYKKTPQKLHYLNVLTKLLLCVKNQINGLKKQIY